MANVLVVEDQDAIRELLLTYLKLDGHNVAGASDAEQGLAMFRAGEFGIVVSDLMMPGKDGIWLLGQLQAEARDFKFILSTGYDGADVAVNALRHGAFDYVVKPVDSLTFKTKVRDAAAALEAETRSRDAERAAQRRSEEASVLYSIGSIMARNLDLPSALAAAVDHLAEILRRPSFCWVRDQAGLPELLRSAGGSAPSHGDVDEWWRGTHAPGASGGWFMAPLSHAGTDLGCVGVAASGAEPELAQLLPPLGEVLGIAVWNAASFARERRRSEQLRALNEFGRDVLDGREFDVVVARALEGASRIMAVDRGALVGIGGAVPRVHAALHATPADLESTADRWAPVVESLASTPGAPPALSYIPDLDESDHDIGDLVAWARSVVVLPIRSADDERLALILGCSERADAFDADDLAAAETFGELIAVALEASGRLESMERRGFEEQWALLELSDRLASARTEADIAEAAVRIATRSLGAGGVVVHAFLGGNGRVIASTLGEVCEDAPDDATSAVALARRARRPVVCAEIADERRFEPNRHAVARGMTSALVVAASCDGAGAPVEAAIEVYWSASRLLAAREIRLVSLLAQQAAVGLELTRLRSSSETRVEGNMPHPDASTERAGDLHNLLSVLDDGFRSLDGVYDAVPEALERRILQAALAVAPGSMAWLSFFEPDTKTRWLAEPSSEVRVAPPAGVLARLRRGTTPSQCRSRNGRASQAIVPIRHGPAVRGVLVVEGDGRCFTSDELHALALLVQHASLARQLQAEQITRTIAGRTEDGTGPRLERVA